MTPFQEKLDNALNAKKTLEAQLGRANALIESLQDECKHVDEKGECTMVTLPLVDEDPRIDPWSVDMCSVCLVVKQQYNPIEA